MRHLLLLLLLLPDLLSAQELRLDLNKIFMGHAGIITCLEFSPDKQSYFSGDSKGWVFHSRLSGKSIWKKQLHQRDVLHIDFSKDNKWMVCTSVDGGVAVAETATGEVVHRVTAPYNNRSYSNAVRFAVFSSDNQRLYFGGDNRYLCKVDLAINSQPEIIFNARRKELNSGVLSGSGKQLIFGTSEQMVFYDLEKQKLSHEMQGNDCLIKSMDITADGQHIINWCGDGSINVWSVDGGILKATFKGGEASEAISNLSFTNREKYSVEVGQGGQFNLWDVSTDKLSFANAELYYDFDHSEQNFLLTSDGNKTVKLWEIVPVDAPEKKIREEIVEQTPQSTEPEKVEVQTDPAPIEKPVVKSKPKNDQPEEETKASQPPKEIPKAEKAAPIAFDLPATINGRKVNKPAEDHRLTFSGNTLTISIWDNKVIDGDVVSLFFNDSCILDNYSLQEIPKRLEVNVSNYSRCYLTLHAHNLGKIPPNTADITISDGSREQKIELRSDMYGSGVAEINLR